MMDIEQVLDSSMAEMSEEQKRDKIYRHPVSGLYNRNAFIAAQANYATKVALVDMDSLKYVNDNESHDIGDGCICRVGTALRQVFGRNAVYHLSGDEFAVLYEGAEYEFKAEMNLVRKRTPIGMSAGFGNTLKEADLALNVDKARRLKSGERVESGKRPPWFGEI